MGRHWKAPKIHLLHSRKENMIKDREKMRNKNYDALSDKEKEIYGILETYAIEVLQHTARGEAVDASVYARIIGGINER